MDESYDIDHSDVLEHFENTIRVSGHKVSSARRLIVRSLFVYDRAFNARELFEVVRSEDRSISITSIYRTLSLLEECKLIRRVVGIEKKQLYEVVIRSSARVYIFCEDCGETIPVEDSCRELRRRYLHPNRSHEDAEISVHIRARFEQIRIGCSCNR